MNIGPEIERAGTAVYVPRPSPELGRDVLAAGKFLGIDAGSGIVGTPQENGRVLVDYEGRRYGQANMVTYADRVYFAWGRHKERYPTVARSWLTEELVLQIGWFDPQAGRVDLLGRATLPVMDDALLHLLGWLNVDELDEAELLCTGWNR